jgi:hypothetical protein
MKFLRVGVFDGLYDGKTCHTATGDKISLIPFKKEQLPASYASTKRTQKGASIRK